MRDLIQGKYKEKLPATGIFLWVDVRDVALAHVRAIEVPEAGGQRFFVVSGQFSNKQIADVIRETHPELEDKLPPKDSPEDLSPDTYVPDNSKSVKVLGLKYRSLKESISDTVKSLLAVGA